jgi:hypothetical protein
MTMIRIFLSKTKNKGEARSDNTHKPYLTFLFRLREETLDVN